MSNYRKGRNAEYRAKAILVAAGYFVARAAGSKGAADLIAWNTQSFRLISVKSGGTYASAVEREALQLLPVPSNTSKEIWRFSARCRQPVIEVL